MAKFVTFSAWQELWEGGAERYELQKITDETRKARGQERTRERQQRFSLATR